MSSRRCCPPTVTRTCESSALAKASRTVTSTCTWTTSASTPHAPRNMGASVVRRGHGIVTMRSPGGLDFCVVAHHGEHERPLPALWPDGHRSLLDQVSVDVAPHAFETECAFWSEFTGWPLHEASRSEFAYLTRPAGVALRLLFQRVQDTAKQRASAHLDFASDDVASEVLRHETLGARVLWRLEDWTTLCDPAGLAYCVTRRRPDTGTPGSTISVGVAARDVRDLLFPAETKGIIARSFLPMSSIGCFLPASRSSR